MPTEIFDVEIFIKLSGNAKCCTVKKLGNLTKLKIRSPKTLYTLKVDRSRAEEIFKKLKCEIKEI